MAKQYQNYKPITAALTHEQYERLKKLSSRTRVSQQAGCARLWIICSRSTGGDDDYFRLEFVLGRIRRRISGGLRGGGHG
jgi:hypothetical protein